VLVILGSGQLTLGAIFLDLAKAFDCVNRDILLRKLEHCGTRGGAYDLLKSFLCGTSQKVGVLTSRRLINYYWGSSRVYISTDIVFYLYQ